MTGGAAGPPSSTSTPEEGRFFTRHGAGAAYRISGKLGQGGMGEVYRATDLLLGQTVALKFLTAHHAAGETTFLLVTCWRCRKSTWHVVRGPWQQVATVALGRSRCSLGISRAVPGGRVAGHGRHARAGD